MLRRTFIVHLNKKSIYRNNLPICVQPHVHKNILNMCHQNFVCRNKQDFIVISPQKTEKIKNYSSMSEEKNDEPHTITKICIILGTIWVIFCFICMFAMLAGLAVECPPLFLLLLVWSTCMAIVS